MNIKPSAAEVEARVRADLAAVLEKWNAELSAEDHYPGYPECGEDVRMTISVPAVYGQDGETIRERVEIDLGRFV